MVRRNLDCGTIIINITRLARYREVENQSLAGVHDCVSLPEIRMKVLVVSRRIVCAERFGPWPETKMIFRRLRYKANILVTI